MDWFAVHVVMAIYLKLETFEAVPVYENIFLIQATSEEEAIKKGTGIGRDEEGDANNSLTWDGKPAVQKFVGVRKAVLCVDSSNRPTDGSEITYSQFLLGSTGDVEKFSRGESVPLLVVE